MHDLAGNRKHAVFVICTKIKVRTYVVWSITVASSPICIVFVICTKIYIYIYCILYVDYSIIETWTQPCRRYVPGLDSSRPGDISPTRHHPDRRFFCDAKLCRRPPVTLFFGSLTRRRAAIVLATLHGLHHVPIR